MQVSDWIRLHPELPLHGHLGDSMEAVATAVVSHARPRDFYLVDGGGRVIGFIRHRRLAQILLVEHLSVQTSHQIMERISSGSVREVMERDFVSARPGEVLDNVLGRMLEYEVEDMSVVNDADQLVGNINLTDVVRAAHRDEF